MREAQYTEKKSLKIVTGKSSDWTELAKDCVCFANTRGGIIRIGIENEDEIPIASQKIDQELPNKIRKRIAELTVNVATDVRIIVSENGGEYIELKVLQTASTIASTTEGKYYYRISDSCNPLLPDEMLRLLTDKPAFIYGLEV